MTIWHMRIACWIPKAKYTNAVCVIQIAFPLQQWLQGSTSMLRYTHFAYLVQIHSGYSCVARVTSRPLYTRGLSTEQGNAPAAQNVWALWNRDRWHLYNKD
jgi:hypothetical protein